MSFMDVEQGPFPGPKDHPPEHRLEESTKNTKEAAGAVRTRVGSACAIAGIAAGILAGGTTVAARVAGWMDSSG